MLTPIALIFILFNSDISRYYWQNIHIRVQLFNTKQAVCQREEDPPPVAPSGSEEGAISLHRGQTVVVSSSQGLDTINGGKSILLDYSFRHIFCMSLDLLYNKVHPFEGPEFINERILF